MPRRKGASDTSPDEILVSLNARVPRDVWRRLQEQAQSAARAAIEEAVQQDAERLVRVADEPLPQRQEVNQ